MKKYISIIVALLLALSFAACSQNDSTPADPPAESQPAEEQSTDPETLTIAISKDESTLTPYTYVTGTPGLEVLRLVYDSLFTLDSDGKIIPWMIEDDYTVDADNKVYSMQLKSDLKWHDGEALTAEDVKFTMEYPLEQNMSRWKKIANMIESVDAKESGEITITLKEGNPNFLREGLADMPIVAKHIYDGVADATTVADSIGSGIYKQLEYKTGEYYKFEAAENHFAGEVRVKNINMPIMTDSSSVSQALIAGEIVASTGSIAPEVVETFKGVAGIEIMEGSGFAPTMLAMNCERDELKDAKFRKAIDLAIDKERLVSTVTLGYAEVASPGFVSPDAAEFAGIEPEFNATEANKMLDELGYTEKNSDGIRMNAGEAITFDILVYSSSTGRIRAAELITEDLKAVGIGATVNAMEADTVDNYMWPDFDVANGRDFDLGMWGWSAPVQLNPASVVSLGSSDPTKGNLNIGGYSDADYDALCEDYLSNSTTDGRAEISKKMQEKLADDALFSNLYRANIIAAANTDVYDGWKIQKGTGLINVFSFLK